MTKEELTELICELYGIPAINSMIESQISKFIKQHGLDFKDMGRALVYYVEVQNNKPRPEMGIGIVPHVVKEANIYFENLKKRDEMLKKEGLKINQDIKRDIIIARPERKPGGKYKIDIAKL